MKIKKSLLSLLLFAILLIPSAYSQNLQNQTINQPGCGTPPMTKQQQKYTLNFVDKVAVKRKVGTTFVPIRIHRVTLDDGTGGVAMGDVNKGVANLNNFYLTAGIQFYIASVSTIVSSDWYDFSQDEESLMTSENSIYDAPNVYFVDKITTSSGGGACGYARYPGDYDASLNILMANGCLLNGPNGTFVHEFGHFFNLAHTHQSTEFGNDNGNAENVPRTGENSNCGATGDLLCDTQADPNGSNDNNCNFVNDGESTEDANGLAYTPDIDNVMSYYSDSCGGIFTPEQYTRITNALATRLSHTDYTLDAAPEDVSNASGLTATTNASYGIDLAWTDNASNELGYLVERSSDGGTTWASIIAGGVDQDLTTFTDATIFSNTAYKYRVKASNDNGNEYSNEVSIDIGLIYCTPTHQGNSCDPNNSDIGVAIYNLTLDGDDNGDISNLDNGCEGPLSIFSSDHSANVTAGNNYTVVGDFIKDGSNYPQYLTIWIDLNQDGDFEDANEMMYQAASDARTFSEPITIPATAINGTTTMRLRTAHTSMGQVTSPCGYIAFSETEDYELIVSGNTLQQPIITFNNIVSSYGGADFNLEATSNSTGIINYTIVGENSTGTSLRGTNNETINIGNAGSVVIRATQEADNSFSLATQDITLTIEEAPLIVAANTGSGVGISKVYGATDPTFSYTITGFVNSDVEGDLDTGITISRVAGENVGDYTITPSGAADSNYSISFVTATFSIAPADLTVTANTGTSKVYGVTDPTLSYTITSFVNDDEESDLDTGVSISRVAGENAGDYTITPSGAADSNYSISFVTSPFSIAPAGLTVTGLEGDDKVYDGTTEATASGTPGLSGILSNDVVVLEGSPVFTFESAELGTDITITTTGYTILGVDSVNYNLTQPIISADIKATLSLDDNSLIDLVKIHPNPVMSELYIKTNSIQLEQVVVYDVLGKVIINTKLNLDKIDVSTLVLGMYILKIKTNQGTVVRRVIKK